MAKNKKSAIPEQYSNIDKLDVSKELANAGLSGVDAPQMTAKTPEQIGQAAQRDFDIDKADWERLTAPNVNGAFDPKELGPEDFKRFTELRNKYPDFQYNSRIDTTPANVAENKGQVVEALTGSPEEGAKAKAAAEVNANPNTLTYDENGNVTGTSQEKDNAGVKFESSQPEITGDKNADEMTAKVKNDEKKKFQLKSIMQAYYDGDFGEVGSDAANGTRDYLLVNTFATAARNISRDLANISAAYTGGSINNAAPEQSQWSQRNAEVMKSATEGAKADVAGSRESRKAQLENAQIRAANFDNLSTQERFKLANDVKSYLYDENGNLKYKANDPTFKMLVDEFNQLQKGGRVSGSILNDILKELMSEMNW